MNVEKRIRSARTAGQGLPMTHDHEPRQALASTVRTVAPRRNEPSPMARPRGDGDACWNSERSEAKEYPPGMWQRMPMTKPLAKKGFSISFSSTVALSSMYSYRVHTGLLRACRRRCRRRPSTIAIGSLPFARTAWR